MKRQIFALSGALISACSAPAAAHFQLIYTPEVVLDRPGEIPLRLIFWHPMDNGYAMDMAEPHAFYYRFRGQNTDLMDRLTPFTFEGASNEARAYAGSAEIKRSGDYTLVLVPAPYYEASEDIYIQQLTKSFVNRGGLPIDWMEPVGLPTEIVPLNKPYGVIAGSTFSGVVLAEGEPVPGARIEIEYMAAEPDLETNAPKQPTSGPVPGGAIAAVADADGAFTFGIPRAGFWGFAALGSGPVTEHEGKHMSQDAVLWVHANEMP